MGFSIITERLIIEDPIEHDLDNFRSIARDPDVMKYVLIWLENDEQIAAFHRRALDAVNPEGRLDYIASVRIMGTREFAGLSFIDIDPAQKSTAEIGCVLLPEFWGSGYALEILNSFVAFGFETLSLHRVFGKCDELNIPSARVMEKGGLRYEGTIREHVWLRDHWRSTRYYGMLAYEYFSRVP